MKAVLIKARDNFKAGDIVECNAQEFAVLADGGFAVTETEHKAQQAAVQANVGRVNDAVTRAKSRGAVLPKDETVQAKAVERLTTGAASADILVEMIDNLPGKDETILASRVTQFQQEQNGVSGRVTSMNADPRDAAIKACDLRKPMDNLIRTGRIAEAAALSRESAVIIASEIQPKLRGGNDFMLRDIVRAADVTDSNVGTIAGSLVLMRNLGYLKNILNFMPYISTDLRNEPALYNQPVFTRYITPPAVSSYNAPTASGSGTSATTTGGWVDATPSTTDVSVTMNKHYGVQISFNTQLLGSTVRNLLAEQVSAQTYSLGEQITKDFLATIFGATWSGLVKSYALGGSFNLSSFAALKNRATLAKMPAIGRFALLHSYYHDGILTDTNLVTAKAITALVNKDLSALESAELPILYGLKPLESQLSSYASGTATAPAIDATTGAVSFAGINQVGFVGNQSSALMVSRIPQDYTQAFPNIPATAAIEIVTDPDSGLSMLNCKYVNHQLATVTNRLSLMYGFAQGDPRQGIVLTP